MGILYANYNGVWIKATEVYVKDREGWRRVMPNYSENNAFLFPPDRRRQIHTFAPFTTPRHVI